MLGEEVKDKGDLGVIQRMQWKRLGVHERNGAQLGDAQRSRG